MEKTPNNHNLVKLLVDLLDNCSLWLNIYQLNSVLIREIFAKFQILDFVLRVYQVLQIIKKKSSSLFFLLYRQQQKNYFKN